MDLIKYYTEGLKEGVKNHLLLSRTFIQRLLYAFVAFAGIYNGTWPIPIFL